jgi:hypothetical protein
MCNDVNETKKKAENISSDNPSAATRRLIALAALTRLDEHAKRVSQIRKALELARELHERCAGDLAATERLVEQMEDLIMDEAMAIAGLEDDDRSDDDEGCDCGCMGGEEGDEDATSRTFDDEEEDRPQPNARPRSDAPGTRDVNGRPPLVPLVFGALGVACAVASLVARSLSNERKE